MKFVDLEEIYCGWWCMIRLLMIGLIIIVFIWILNNFYYKNKTPLLRKINPVLSVLFFLLLLLVAFKLFPKLGLNPLLVLQKLSTLLGIIWFDWVVRWKWLISSSWNRLKTEAKTFAARCFNITHSLAFFKIRCYLFL